MFIVMVRATEIKIVTAQAMKEKDAAMKEAQLQLQEVNWKKINKEIRREMDKVDWAAIQKDISKAMEESRKAMEQDDTED